MKASCMCNGLTPHGGKHPSVCGASREKAARSEPLSKRHSHARNASEVQRSLFRTRESCMRRRSLESAQASRSARFHRAPGTD